MKKRIVIIVTIVSMLFPLCGYAQRRTEQNVAVGVKGGMTMSRVNFAPSIQQGLLKGLALGVSARYIEEAHFGLIGEFFIEQRGWQESFEDLPFQYSRKFTYLQIPILTHIFFGSDKARFFINLGPEFSFMIGESVSSNFDVTNTASIADFPANRHTQQYLLDVNSKFDYGIAAGMGVEVNVNRRNSILLEGRFYYGLGNVFSSHKSDYFSASPGMSIMVTLGYMFRLK